MSTFSFPDHEEYARFREVLLKAGFTAEGVLETLGIKGLPQFVRSDVPILLRRTMQRTPLNILIRLFLIEVPVDREVVRQAIQPMRLETLIQAGLIEIDGASVVASVKLLPHVDLFIAYDLPRRLEKGMHDYVMGIGSRSITLSNLTVRRPSHSTLDLGTGCGIQALLAAKHSDCVLAVNKNPRAVQIAAFNAKLNGMDNVECLEGNLFEPVMEHMFDLVISNPPFVISPEMRYIYRDSGMDADQICQEIVRQVPKFLREGGYCQILCNWADYSGRDWRERLAGWFEGTGCDAWVIRSETRDAETYASTWIHHTEMHEPEHFAQRFEEWMAYYDQKRIESISAGLITMRCSSGHSNWFRSDDGPEKMLGPCGDYIVRGFELHDFLENMRDDSTLLNTRLCVSPDVCLDKQCKPSTDGWTEVEAKLHLTRGLAYSGSIDPYIAGVVIGCNGQRPLSDLLSAMASSLGLDLVNIKKTFCDVIRRLIERGFLLPLHLVI